MPNFGETSREEVICIFDLILLFLAIMAAVISVSGCVRQEKKLQRAGQLFGVVVLLAILLNLAAQSS